MAAILQSTTTAVRPKPRRRPVPLHRIDFRALDDLDDLQESLEVHALRAQIRQNRSIPMDTLTTLQ
ncbi:hypothetical protein D9M69_458380 [compost metagenome]